MFKKLTKSEMDVMEYFWKEQRPITCREILDAGGEEKWSSGYLHNTIRSMLTKGAIRVTGKDRVGRFWTKSFEAAFTREEYVAKVALSLGADKDTIIYVILAMAEESGNKQFEREIRKLIESK